MGNKHSRPEDEQPTRFESLDHTQPMVVDTGGGDLNILESAIRQIRQGSSDLATLQDGTAALGRLSSVIRTQGRHVEHSVKLTKEQRQRLRNLHIGLLNHISMGSPIDDALQETFILAMKALDSQDTYVHPVDTLSDSLDEPVQDRDPAEGSSTGQGPQDTAQEHASTAESDNAGLQPDVPPDPSNLNNTSTATAHPQGTPRDPADADERRSPTPQWLRSPPPQDIPMPDSERDESGGGDEDENISLDDEDREADAEWDKWSGHERRENNWFKEYREGTVRIRQELMAFEAELDARGAEGEDMGEGSRAQIADLHMELDQRVRFEAELRRSRGR